MRRPIARTALLLTMLSGLGCAQMSADATPREAMRGLATVDARPDSRNAGMISTGTEPGLFYDDGGDSDLFGRTENLFDGDAAATPPPTHSVSQGTATTVSGFHGDDSSPRPAPETANPAKPRSERKMVYTAAYTLLVSSIDEAIARLLRQAEAAGGYLAKRADARLTVRIPAAKFHPFLAELPAYGRVLSESMSALDVTSKHTDLAIRLENAEKSRKRLLALLDRAEKMADVIQIETALRRLTAEIEQMKGQLKLLNSQITYSTVNVAFQANAPKAKPKRRRSNSRFGWINRIGIEQDLRRFQP